MKTAVSVCAVGALVCSSTAGLITGDELFGLDALTGDIVVIDDPSSQSGLVTPGRVIQTGLGQLSNNGSNVELAAGGGRLFVADRQSVSIFDAASGAAAGSFTITTATRGLAARSVAGLGLTLFNWTNSDNLELLDPATGAIRQSYAISGVSIPTGAAFDPATGEVIVGTLGGAGEIIRIDPATGQVVSRVSAMGRDYSSGLAWANGNLYGVQPFGASRDTFQRIAPDGTFQQAFELTGDYQIGGIAALPTPGSMSLAAATGVLLLHRRR